MRNLLRLAAVGATSIALAGGVLLAPANAGDTPREENAGNWLVGQLTSGLVHSDQFGGYDDYGLSIDVAFGLRAIGGYSATVNEINTAVAAHVNSYTTGVDFGSADIYAGPTAKALVMAQISGANPTSYGGVNLVRRVNGRIATKAPIAGRLQDKSSKDYANTIGQAYAVRGLTKAGSPKASSALGFLLKQQCRRGYFRLSFTPSKTRRNQTCDGGTATASAPDTDATAIAVISLSALNSRKPAVKTAISRAVTWLARRQKADGSFGGGTSTEASNANSTGLAGWALGVRGYCRPANKAAVWLAALQVQSATSGSALAADIGAIGYDKAGYDAAVAVEAIAPEGRDQWRRASAQAAPALANYDLAACQAR